MPLAKSIRLGGRGLRVFGLRDSCAHAGTAHHGNILRFSGTVFRGAKLDLDRDAGLQCLFLQAYR
jgi:hypothetical protein